MDELRHRQGLLPATPSTDQVAELLTYAHHRLVAIHSFTNGNGRTARFFTNLLAYGYHELVLYQREVGEARTHYLAAIRSATALRRQIRKKWRSGDASKLPELRAKNCPDGLKTA
jgi:cell filamentation protein